MHGDYSEVGQNAVVVAIQGLKDEELQDKINQFIRESREKLQSKNSEYEQYVALKENCIKEGINVQTECKNGYLSVQVLLTYRLGTEKYQYIYDGYSKIYDLYTGNELGLSDLYYKDTDFISIINEQIQTILVEKAGVDANYLQTKRPFVGVTDNISIYGIDTIGFTKNNPYFTEGVIFELNTYFDNISVVNEERNMEGIWNEDIAVSKEAVNHEANGSNLQRGNIMIKEIQNCVYNVFYINTNNSEIDAKINEIINAYVNNERITPLLKKVLENNPQEKFILNEKNQYQITIDNTILGNKFATMRITVNPKNKEIVLGRLIFDLETGETVSSSDYQKWKTENGVE